VFNRFVGLPSSTVVWVISFLIMTMLLFVLVSKKTTNRHISNDEPQKIPKEFIAVCVLQSIIWFFYASYHGDSAYITRIFFILYSFVAISALQKSIGVSAFIKTNNYIIQWQVILGVLAFFLIFFGILGPVITFDNEDGREAYFYGLTCSNAVYGNVARIAGFFDEPGALAAWGMYALIFNKLFIGNKIVEYFLLFGLISTLSLAYFAQVALYILFFYRKNTKVIIPVTILLALIFVLIYKQGSDSEMYLRTFERVDMAINGKTNRDVMVDNAKYAFMQNPAFGIGASNADKFDSLTDNPYETLATDGVIGTIFIYLPLIVALLVCKLNKRVLAAIVVLAVGYLQRPFHISPMHYLHIYCFLYLTIVYYAPRYRRSTLRVNNNSDL
jgi:hypothetical protein